MLSSTFRDNDRIYGQGLAGFLKSCQIEEVRTAYGCPWQNPFVERFGGSLRREENSSIYSFSTRSRCAWFSTITWSNTRMAIRKPASTQNFDGVICAYETHAHIHSRDGLWICG